MLDELAPEARALHSVNTVLFRNGRRIGHNTDWWGFAESFKRDMSDAHTDDVVLVGAGGAGAAVGYAMLKLGARTLTVHDTDESRTAALVSRLDELFPQRRVRVCRRPEHGAGQHQWTGACNTHGHAQVSRHAGAR
jgi:shikimate dehydrogenase